jgi:hypothetical protein
MGTHIKAATMDDVRQSPNTDKVERAFERFGRRQPRIVVPNREHLDAVFRPGLSCEHRWTEITDPTQKAFVLKKHEEEKAERAEFCPDCGATCLREADVSRSYSGVEVGEIFSFDATFRFSDRPKAERKEKRK